MIEANWSSDVGAVPLGLIVDDANDRIACLYDDDIIRRSSYREAISNRPLSPLSYPRARGVAVNRSTFTAFGMDVPENDVAPIGSVHATARGPVGPLHWAIQVGWRESEHDLGDLGDTGESTSSGFITLAGVALAC